MKSQGWEEGWAPTNVRGKALTPGPQVLLVTWELTSDGEKAHEPSEIS